MFLSLGCSWCCAAGGILQPESLEKTVPNTQPSSPSRGSPAVEPRGNAAGLQNGQAKPLTGRAGALAAVERLYQDHGEELKQLADA
jgi:hypothetical protein